MASPMPPTPPFDVWRMPFWTTLESFWHILGSVWCMLMSFCQFWRHLGCQIGAKRRSWGTWWAPWLPQGVPRGPLGAQGCHFGRFWGHFWSQNRTKIDARNQCFFEHEFWQILRCFGVPFCTIFWSFSGAAGIDHEKTGYVKFVDGIEKLADFLEN